MTLRLYFKAVRECLAEGWMLTRIQGGSWYLKYPQGDGYRYESINYVVYPKMDDEPGADLRRDINAAMGPLDRIARNASNIQRARLVYFVYKKLHEQQVAQLAG